jgi:hypothetical protein
MSETDISGHDVPFTQYLMPNGRRENVTLSVDGETYPKARQILDAGYRFEVEMLSDMNTVSATIFDPEKEEDVAICLAPNGPEVPARIKAMILKFNIPAKRAATEQPK